MFELFDPQGDLQISQGGHLPHWHQPGVTYFVTFRTEDSMPVEVSQQWRRRRDDWLRRRGVAPGNSAGLSQLSKEQQREFHETFSREYLEYLDQGLGACVLRRPKIARQVSDSLHHFDDVRYHLGDFVIMPNHVHLLVCLLGSTNIEDLCYSWKKFSATQINRLLGRTGRLWQEESFDHLVRTQSQFEAIQRYIAENPIKAGLVDGEYLHYRP
jgi:type I restriction enzyme R subunit